MICVCETWFKEYMINEGVKQSGFNIKPGIGPTRYILLISLTHRSDPFVKPIGKTYRILSA